MVKHFTLDRKLKIGFAVALILVIIVGVLSYLTFRQQGRQADLVKQTYKIIQQAEKIQKLLVDIESGRRGFRVTNDANFLEAYDKGKDNIRPAIKELDLLVNENTSLDKQISDVTTVVDSLLNFWALLGRDAGSYTTEDIQEMMYAEKQRMDNVRASVEVVLDSLEQTLRERERENALAIRRATIELGISIGLILFIVIALIFKIVNEFKSRRNAEQKLVKTNQDIIKANRETAAQNWLLAGLAKVNNALHSEVEMQQLSNGILATIVEYLEVDSAGIYIYDENEKQLVLAATHALPTDARTSYLLNEGLIGQAAVAEEPIVLKNIPANQITIESGVVKAVPAEAIYASVHLDGSIKAVIELFKFQPFDDMVLKMLSVVKNNIAVAIHSVQSRQKVLQLLEQVQNQKEVLENQQEELRQVNEELSLQAEVLQASEEELRVQEEELRQINAELEEKNETIESASQSLFTKARELEDISRYKSDFLANMSHELRTPLNSILILAKLLADNSDKNLTEKQLAHAKIIHKSGRDLLQLINDILDLSKIEAGKMELHQEEISLQVILHDMQQLFSMVAEEKQINYKIKVDEEVPTKLVTDKQKIEQVLSNLLSNAFKFTEAGGSVSLLVSAEVNHSNSFFVFTVSDTGIGIPEAKQLLIFDAFQQADSSTSRKYGGTGLGLSIISRLVSMLGGKITVTSEEGVGSSFTITLPASLAVAPDQEVLPSVDTANVEQQWLVKDDRNNLQPGDDIMLIIEDDADLASIIRNYAHSKNYKAIVALQGDQGLHDARAYKPSVIILDMNLPVMDGTTILKYLKSDPELQHIPVHIISANEEMKFAKGAFSFLQKPFNHKDLDQAFTVISEYLKVSVKRVLLISKDENNKQEIIKLLNAKDLKVAYDVADNVKEATQKITSRQYHTIIADVTGDFNKGLQEVQWLHEQVQAQKVPVIIYIDEDIPHAKELELKKVANVVIRKSISSSKRLMDELELFLYKVKEQNQPERINLKAVSTKENIVYGKKVLLVDDDMRNVFAMNEALEQENMQVVVASDGKEAVEILKQQKDFDIVLMDVMMPEMDGYEATRIIRNKLHLTQLPIIALTAKAMAEDKQKCIEAGASDYISKPVDIQKLISLMKVWLA